MEDSNDKSSPFSYALSEDKTTLKLDFNKVEKDFTASEMMDLIRFLAIYRAQMEPKFPDRPADSHPLEIFQADSYLIANHPETGTAQVFLRMPGLGWAMAEFPPDDCAHLSECLARSIPAAPRTAH